MTVILQMLEQRLRSQSSFSPIAFRPDRRQNRVTSKDVRPAETAAAASIRLREAATLIAKAGVFDSEFYLAYNVDVRRAGIDPLAHYIVKGFRERRKPNSFFDPEFYIGATDEVGPEDDPLLHYVKSGDAQGLAPCELFDPAWYRSTYALRPEENALGHYLAHKMGPFSPIPEFDAQYYLKTYKDVAAAKVEPFLHYIAYGFKEGRNPSAIFDTKFYLHRHMKGDLTENPLSHYRRNRSKGLSLRSSDDEPTIPANVKRFTKPGTYFEECRPIAESVPRKVKILAYYLTQFHAFPENDRWWAKDLRNGPIWPKACLVFTATFNLECPETPDSTRSMTKILYGIK